MESSIRRVDREQSFRPPPARERRRKREPPGQGFEELLLAKDEGRRSPAAADEVPDRERAPSPQEETGGRLDVLG